MTGEFEKGITIEKAIKEIDARRYLLPAIQRKFTWRPAQVCTLFDSLMRGYPLNTFMFWEVQDEKIKEKFQFYNFLSDYCERFKEDNQSFNTRGYGNFHAVIDGQQRLTSLYIGLKGTYAYKIPGKWWPQARDENILPSRTLYINLASSLDEEANEERMKNEFKFLTKKEYEKDKKNPDKFWFEVGKILSFPVAQTDDVVLDIVVNFLQEEGLETNKNARKALTRLYFAIRRDNTIHFYNETSQEIDHVLDIFIRTNSGGTQLSLSDLLMSIAIANWKEDARKQIDDLVYQVRSGSDMGFSINRDFVLKAALMLSENEVRFKVENFTAENVNKIEEKWDEIKFCIVEAFRLIRSFGINDASLRAKNATIPIAYYLFHKNKDKANGNLYADINKKARHELDRKKISQWLHMSLLRSVFGGQGDTLLLHLREVIQHNLSNPTGFPLKEIIEKFRGTNKSLSFDDEDFIERLLKTRKGDSNCFSILAILFPDLDFTRSLNIDHLHPVASFDAKRLDVLGAFENPGGRSFYENVENWDGIANLQLLDSSKNKSKGDMPLLEWCEKEGGVVKVATLLPEDLDLSFKKFEEFVLARTLLLKKRFTFLIT